MDRELKRYEMKKIHLPQKILNSVEFFQMRYRSMPVNAKMKKKKKRKTKMHISNGKKISKPLIVFFIRLGISLYSS